MPKEYAKGWVVNLQSINFNQFGNLANGFLDSDKIQNVVNMTDEEYKQWQANKQNETQTGDLNSDIYDCEICKNRGFMWQADKDQLYSSECKCVKIRRGIASLMKNKINYKTNKLNLFEAKEDWQKELKQKALDFSKLQKGCFFVGGMSGSGKTHICTGIAMIFLNKGKSLNYIRWLDLGEKLKYLKTDIARYEKEIEEIRNADILYIDDLWKCKDNQLTNADIKLAMEIIDTRYNSRNENKITIISSEMHFTEIYNVDNATGGRIAEMCTKQYITNIEKTIENNYRMQGII